MTDSFCGNTSQPVQERIWVKILLLVGCAAYCWNCDPNSHALRAQTRVSVPTLCSPTHGFSNKCLSCTGWLAFPVYWLY